MLRFNILSQRSLFLWIRILKLNINCTVSMFARMMRQALLGQLNLKSTSENFISFLLCPDILLYFTFYLFCNMCWCFFVCLILSVIFISSLSNNGCMTKNILNVKQAFILYHRPVLVLLISLLLVSWMSWEDVSMMSMGCFFCGDCRSKGPHEWMFNFTRLFILEARHRASSGPCCFTIITSASSHSYKVHL